MIGDKKMLIFYYCLEISISRQILSVFPERPNDTLKTGVDFWQDCRYQRGNLNFGRGNHLATGSHCWCQDCIVSDILRLCELTERMLQMRFLGYGSEIPVRSPAVGNVSFRIDQ